MKTGRFRHYVVGFHSVWSIVSVMNFLSPGAGGQRRIRFYVKCNTLATCSHFTKFTCQCEQCPFVQLLILLLPPPPPPSSLSPSSPISFCYISSNPPSMRLFPCANDFSLMCGLRLSLSLSCFPTIPLSPLLLPSSTHALLKCIRTAGKKLSSQINRDFELASSH